MHAKIIKILNFLFIFMLFVANCSCSKDKPEEQVFIITYEINKQYDINEDINITIYIGTTLKGRDSTIAYVSMINRKYVEVNAYDPYKDLYQKEEAHIIKIIDDFCAENYPIYHLKKGCKTEDKCLYSFNSCIPKEILEDNGGLFLIAFNWDKINRVRTISYEIFDETVEFTKLFI